MQKKCSTYIHCVCNIPFLSFHINCIKAEGSFNSILSNTTPKKNRYASYDLSLVKFTIFLALSFHSSVSISLNMILSGKFTTISQISSQLLQNSFSNAYYPLIETTDMFYVSPTLERPTFSHSQIFQFFTPSNVRISLNQIL